LAGSAHHDAMLESQLDLFSDAGTRREDFVPERPPAPLVPAEMDDEALIEALAQSRLAEIAQLADEVARRRLIAAVPALADLCLRLAGFGIDRLVPEQAAALEALTAIGGREAAQAVAEMIAKGTFAGPTLQLAVSAAARLRASLPVNVLQLLLRHPQPGIRARACRCARPLPNSIKLLIESLNDGDKIVARSAACALGTMGRAEARPMIKNLLRDAPSPDVIEAAVSIADEECVVLLGRIARTTPALADSALGPRAGTIAASVRSGQAQKANAA
jgi:hypothetical protein